MSRLHIPSAGRPAPGSQLRSATFIGHTPKELTGKTCIVGDACVPGYSMVQFDDLKSLPVAWTHGWHMRLTTDLVLGKRSKARRER